jgi:hypothetical protein
MGLLKNKKRSEKIGGVPELPDLPELPKLPEFEEEEPKNIRPIHQLPRFPNGSLGEKFSQNTIKEAVTGKKEGEVFADEFAQDEDKRMMQEPRRMKLPSLSRKKIIREEPQTESSKEKIKDYEKVRENEPLFVRIDKFEEGIKSLDKVREQISEIEKLLKDIQEIREEEEKEFESWEKEIQTAKTEIEKIDDNIFSKVE